MKFAELFKKYRLRSEFATLSELGAALSKEGLVFEDSIFSHWQSGKRIPTSRQQLLTLIKIFLHREGINTLTEANLLMESVGQGYLTDKEVEGLGFLHIDR